MGVDFYACDNCDEIYDDCGGLYDVCEECGKRICYDCQVDMGMRDDNIYFSEGAIPLKDYWEEEKWETTSGEQRTSYNLTSCPYCKLEEQDDEMILDYVLNKYKVTKSEIWEEIKASTKE